MAVSGWPLARAVSKTGQLGVVSSTALTHTLVRRLQLGDMDGKLPPSRRSRFRAWPAASFRSISCRVAKARGSVQGDPASGCLSSRILQRTYRGGQFCRSVSGQGRSLRRRGHQPAREDPVQYPAFALRSHARRRGLCAHGCGHPRTVPGTLDDFSAGRASEIKIDAAAEQPGKTIMQRLDPGSFFNGAAPSLKRPMFLAIVASATLALTLAKKSTGHVDGFVVETETAGGHNAPPRGPMQLTANGEPIYGPRDLPDLGRSGPSACPSGSPVPTAPREN